MVFELRVYQKAAIDNIRRAFHEHHSKCLVHMATGSGKTVVLTSLCKCSEFDGWVVIVVVPSIRLVRQMYRCFQDQTDLRVFAYDDKTQKKKNTCDVFVTTYNSLSSIANHEMWNGRRILCLFDEAHHATSDAWLTHCTAPWYDFGVFVTATPISRPGGIRMLPTESMVDGVCGPLVFSYNIADGMYDGVIDSFRIVAPTYRESVSDFIKTCMDTYGHEKVICFCGRADTPDLVLDDVRSLVLNHDWNDMDVLGVVGNGSIMRDSEDAQVCPVEFLERDGRRVVITCTAIGEGVDTACCEMVCFANPKHSTVSIVQNVGRALRPKGKVSTVALNCPRSRLSVEGWDSILNVIACMVDPIRSDEMFTCSQSLSVDAPPRRCNSACNSARDSACDSSKRKKPSVRYAKADVVELKDSISKFVVSDVTSLLKINTPFAMILETSNGAILDYVPTENVQAKEIRISKTRSGKVVITKPRKPRTNSAITMCAIVDDIDTSHHISHHISELSLTLGRYDYNSRLDRIMRRWISNPQHSCSWYWFLIRLHRLHIRGIQLGCYKCPEPETPVISAGTLEQQ